MLDASPHEHLILPTPAGPVEARHHDAPGATAAVLYVGGVGGGFDTPARGLYPRLAEELTALRIGGLRIRFRRPGQLGDCVADVLAGLRFLEERGVVRVALVGHSFGGAVVITAATRAPAVCAIVALATQAHGTGAVAALAPRPLLLVHGTADEILPPACSIDVFERAREPRTLRLIDGARHVLDEAADELHADVRAFLLAHLASA